MYVYIRSEPGLYTVGHYDPSGKWHPESDHTNDIDAANRVHFLNGGTNKPHHATVKREYEHFFKAWRHADPSIVEYVDKMIGMAGIAGLHNMLFVFFNAGFLKGHDTPI